MTLFCGVSQQRLAALRNDEKWCVRHVACIQKLAVLSLYGRTFDLSTSSKTVFRFISIYWCKKHPTIGLGRRRTRRKGSIPWLPRSPALRIFPLRTREEHANEKIRDVNHPGKRTVATVLHPDSIQRAGHKSIIAFG